MIRAPGRNSASSLSFSMFTVFGSRYIVSTVACEMSVLNRSCVMNLTRSAMPSFCAASFDSLTSLSWISTPNPRAPNTFAAVRTILPSPEPRSMTKSLSLTPASFSMSVTTLCGDGTYGPALTGLSWASALHASVAAARKESAVLFMGNFRRNPEAADFIPIPRTRKDYLALHMLDDELHALQPVELVDRNPVGSAQLRR